MSSAAIADRPEHVPPHLAANIDCLAPVDWQSDVHRAWLRIKQSHPPIFWTPHHGGHWICTRGEFICRMQIDTRTFSHAKYTIPHTPEASDAPPASSDGLLHSAYRALIAPALMPATIRKLEPEIRSLTRQTIHDLAPRGRCEFIGEFAQVVPITVFLRLVDLPMADRPYLLALANRTARPQDLADRLGAMELASAYLADKLTARRTTPGSDMLSRIVHGEVCGRAITADEATKLCRTLLFGGLDTVAAMQGFFALHLARHPDSRWELGQAPEKIAVAVEELIRRFGVANSARMVTQDIVFEGVALKAGDQMLLPNALVGLDEDINPAPMEVQFDRPQARRHAAFGNGAHACPGAALARLEFRIFLEEWLAQIPDFSIDDDRAPILVTGFINSVASLNLKWDIAKPNT